MSIGLEDEIVGLHVYEIAQILPVRRDKDYDDVRIKLPQPPGKIKAVHSGHLYVEKSKFHLVLFSVFKSFFGIHEGPGSMKVPAISMAGSPSHSCLTLSRAQYSSSTIIVFIKRSPPVFRERDGDLRASSCLAFYLRIGIGKSP